MPSTFKSCSTIFPLEQKALALSETYVASGSGDSKQANCLTLKNLELKTICTTPSGGINLLSFMPRHPDILVAAFSGPVQAPVKIYSLKKGSICAHAQFHTSALTSALLPSLYSSQILTGSSDGVL